MTDTTFYSRMDELATKLLTKFGSPATYRSTPPAPKPNAQGIVIKPAPVDTPGLGVRTMNREVMDMFQKQSEIAMVVKFPVASLDTEQKIVHGGETWKIQEIKPVNPLGTSMLVAFVSCVKP